MRSLAPGRAEAEADERYSTGVWRRVHDRFHRAVDRYHQVIEGVPEGPLRDDLERGGTRLAACLDVVAATCAQAQRDTPSADLTIPNAARDLYARLSRAATQAAQAAEAAAMARVGASGPAGAGAVLRAVGQVEELVSPPTPS